MATFFWSAENERQYQAYKAAAQCHGLLPINSEIRTHEIIFSTDGGRTWADPPTPPAPSYRSREGLDAPTEITADDASAIGRALRFRRG